MSAGSLMLLAALVFCATSAYAADDCQGLVKSQDLPGGFKVISRSALGPAELVIVSDGNCTCNDLPAVQRKLGQPQPDGVNWACAAADAADSKGK